MKKSLLTLFVVIQCLSLRAQVSSYNWYKVSRTYATISGASTTLASGNSINDALFTNQSIGFPFIFNGTAYNSVGVSTNGFIWFGTATPSTTDYNPLSTNDGCDGIVSVFGSNLHSMDVSSAVSFQTTGIAPDRIFTVEWKKFGRLTSMGDYQVKLYEDSGFIECHYNHAPYFIDDTFTGEVGLRGADNTDFNNREISCSGTVSWEKSLAGTSSSATCAIDGQTPCSLYPHTNTTYIWSSYTLPFLVLGSPEHMSSPGNSGLFSIINNSGIGSFEIVLSARQQRAEVQIFNCLGQQVFAKQVSEPVSSIPVAMGACQKGIYFVQVSGGKALSTQKIILE